MNSRQHYAIAVEAARQRRRLARKRCTSLGDANTARRSTSSGTRNACAWSESGSRSDLRSERGSSSVAQSSCDATRQRGQHTRINSCAARQTRPAAIAPGGSTPADSLNSSAPIRSSDRPSARVIAFQPRAASDVESRDRLHNRSYSHVSSQQSRRCGNAMTRELRRTGRHFSKPAAPERDSDSLVDLLLSLLQPIAKDGPLGTAAAFEVVRKNREDDA